MNFLRFFIITQFILALIYIDNKAKIIKLSYCKQKKENLIADLLEQKRLLKQKILTSKGKDNIKDFAQKNLNLEKINIKQIKKHYDK